MSVRAGTIILVMCAATAPAADWPRFRGPNGDGISTETGLNLTWPAGKKPAELWRAQIGRGYSVVSVADGSVFCRNTEGVLLCLNAAK